MPCRLLLLSWIAGWWGACALPGAEGQPPDLDPEVFRSDVYPILLADCGFVACHGDRGRFFVVYGPGRTRLPPETLPTDPPTDEELALTYARARSASAAEPEASLLLRKPLAVGEGGAGHRGDDDWGRAIFPSKEDPRYRRIRAWLAGTP